jgi:hypothetical protein
LVGRIAISRAIWDYLSWSTSHVFVVKLAGYDSFETIRKRIYIVYPAEPDIITYQLRLRNNVSGVDAVKIPLEN